LAAEARRSGFFQVHARWTPVEKPAFRNNRTTPSAALAQASAAGATASLSDNESAGQAPILRPVSVFMLPIGPGCRIITQWHAWPLRPIQIPVDRRSARLCRRFPACHGGWKWFGGMLN